MRKVDVSAYSSQQSRRIKPEKVDLGDLPPIEKPDRNKPQNDVYKSGSSANARTGERTIKRKSFNVFEDQYKALKRLEYQALEKDLDTNLSVMVREALDEYLGKVEGEQANG